MEKALVIGAARSGKAAAKLLRKAGYDVVLTDMKAIDRQGLEGIQVFDEGHPDSLKDDEYALIVKNPGIPYTAPSCVISWSGEIRSIRKLKRRIVWRQAFDMARSQERMARRP